MTRAPLVILMIAAVSACAPASLPDVNRLAERSGTITLPDPGSGACYADDVTPAVIDTTTEHVVLEPAELGPRGTVIRPAVYETQTRQVIVRERQEQRFEALCEAALTPELITNLQRALAARAFYNGPITGELTWRTRRAVRLYQLDQGINSAILSSATARDLGLVAYGFDRE